MTDSNNPQKRNAEDIVMEDGQSESKRSRSDRAAPAETEVSTPVAVDTTAIPTPMPSTSTSTPAPTPSNHPQLNDHLHAAHRVIPTPVSRLGLVAQVPVLPPSLKLVTGLDPDMAARKGFVGEEEVGIRGFVGGGKGVRGVIKQRFTDFLVNEIGLDGEVLHLKDITKPKDDAPPPVKGKGKEKPDPAAASAPAVELTEEEAANGVEAAEAEAEKEREADAELPENLRFEPHPQWPSSATSKLRPHLSDETIVKLHEFLVAGQNAPQKGDSGWAGRKSKPEGEGEVKMEETVEEAAMNASAEPSTSAGHGQGRGVAGGEIRGEAGVAAAEAGGRGGGRGGTDGWWTEISEDNREVLSQPMSSKEERTNAHKILREIFPGMFESSSREVKGETGQRIVIKWGSGGNQVGVGSKGQRRDPAQPRLPQYIHFTLHKSNRETMDALQSLQRLIGVPAKDLTVCGTKDKRAVTVQRVCLKRGGRTLSTVWRAINGIKQGWRSEAQAVEERGDRGVRIGDLSYSEKYLELGMLKGNRFLITLRNVEAESVEEIDRTMASVRDHGFINFYGMQRFGTSSMPTHITGLLILQSKWTEALESLLSLREGEHPDCVTGRLAWLEDGDVNRALQLMPRRAVAERSIWEFYKRGGSRDDKLGALGCIPRNLRTMYVHAYQSYVWNLVVSERIRLSSTEPLVGDLVFTAKKESTIDPDNVPAHFKDRHGRMRKWETGSSADVRQLTPEDIASKTHTIFDVVVPLPGFDVDYPGGVVGELYDKVLTADGLNMNRMRREQREYSLPGSYRLILLRPLALTWSHLQYTDPDLPLVQSDEDAILGLNPPAPHNPEGKFRAVKVNMSLGASTYATMVLREITREETSSWFQRGRTMRGEDQEHKQGRGTEGEFDAEEGQDADIGTVAE